MSSKKVAISINCIELGEITSSLKIKRSIEPPEFKGHNYETTEFINLKTETLQLPQSNISKMTTLTYKQPNDENNLTKPAEETFCKIIDEKYGCPYLQIRNQKRFLSTFNMNPRKYDIRFPIKNSLKKTSENYFENSNEYPIKKLAKLESDDVPKNEKQFPSELQKPGQDQLKSTNINFDENTETETPEITSTQISTNDETKGIKNKSDKNTNDLTLSSLATSAIAYQSVLDHLNSLSKTVNGSKNFDYSTQIDETTKTDMLMKNSKRFSSTYNSVLENVRSVDIYSPSNNIKSTSLDENRSIANINTFDISYRNPIQDKGLQNTSQSAPVIVGYSTKQIKSKIDYNNPKQRTSTAELVQKVARSRLQLDRYLADRDVTDWEPTTINVELESKNKLTDDKATKRRLNSPFPQSKRESDIIRYVEPFNYLVPLQNIHRGSEPIISNPSSGEDEPEPALLNKELVEIEPQNVSQTFNSDNSYHSTNRVERISNWIVEGRYIVMDIGIFFFLFGVLFLIFVIVNISIETSRTNDLS